MSTLRSVAAEFEEFYRIILEQHCTYVGPAA
jgi:hypothetical protein